MIVTLNTVCFVFSKLTTINTCYIFCCCFSSCCTLFSSELPSVSHKTEAEWKLRCMDWPRSCCDIASQIRDPLWNSVSEIRLSYDHYLSQCCYHSNKPHVCLFGDDRHGFWLVVYRLDVWSRSKNTWSENEKLGLLEKTNMERLLMDSVCFWCTAVTGCIVPAYYWKNT